MSEFVTIDISKDECLVLLELLSRTAGDDSINIVHRAERVVLWNLEALLERMLRAPTG